MGMEEMKDIELEEELEYLDKAIDEPEDEDEEDLIEIDKNAEINMGILKPRAQRAQDITDEMFKKCHEENINLYNEFMEISQQLSKETRKQYRTCLKQFFFFVYTNLGNKPMYKITKRDFMRFMAYLQNRGLSSSAIGLRKAAVSSLCNYIELAISEDDEEHYGKFRNITRGMPPIPKTSTYEKKEITREEYELMKKYLEQKKQYLPLAWLVTMWGVGSRRAEIIQFKTEVIDYKIPEGQMYIESNVVRCKGPGRDGKQLTFMIPLEVLNYWKKWIDIRNFESDLVFARLNEEGQPVPISKQWANRLCENILTPLLGRRITPHNFKATIVTRMLDEGFDLSLISREIAHHNDTSTTSSYYDLRKFEDKKNELFNNVKL